MKYNGIEIMILPIGLFTLFLLNSLLVILAMVWPGLWIDRKYQRIYSLGFRKYHAFEALWSFLKGAIQLLALRYLYFPYVWGIFAVLSLIDTCFHLWACTVGRRFFQDYTSEYPTDAWRQKEVEKRRSARFAMGGIMGLQGLSWCKTFPWLPVQFTRVQEWGISFVFVGVIVGLVVRQTMRENRSSFPLKGDDETVPQCVSGTLDDLARFIRGLMDAEHPGAFVSIRVQGTDDFLQFTGNRHGVQMDFPMVTEHQRQLRPRIERVGEQLDLSLDVNTGSDGTEFLDYDLHGSPEVIAEIVKTVLLEVFHVTEAHELKFEVYGY